MSRTYRRADYRWRMIAHRVYDEEETCWICKGFVDQTLHHREPMARSADHLVQLKHGGDEYDRSGIRLAHLGCNSTRAGRIQNLPKSECACRFGRPCGPVSVGTPRGYVAVDPRAV